MPTIKKFGAWSILLTIIVSSITILGTVVSSSEQWARVKIKVEDLDTRVQRVESLSAQMGQQKDLICAIAIEVAQDKKVVKEACTSGR